MKVIGFKKSDFKTTEGNMIHGVNLYLGYPLRGEDCGGMAVERYYMTDAKLAANGYTPRVDDTVEVAYNRYGKLESIRAVKG